MNEFPLVLPADNGWLRYQGFFAISGHEYAIAFALPDAPGGPSYVHTW